MCITPFSEKNLKNPYIININLTVIIIGAVDMCKSSFFSINTKKM